jgi:hypothetical protein
VPGIDPTLNRKRNGRLVRVLAQLSEVASVGLAAIVAIRAGQTHNEVDAIAAHQFPHPGPATIPFLEA